MTDDPATMRAVAFFDGKNFYRRAKDAFGCHRPNYDPMDLAGAIRRDWAWDEFTAYNGFAPRAKA